MSVKDKPGCNPGYPISSRASASSTGISLKEVEGWWGEAAGEVDMDLELVADLADAEADATEVAFVDEVLDFDAAG